MSDALLESLSDRQIEAVFAHEVGHGRHRHLWWYMAMAVSAMTLSWWLSDQATAGIQRIVGHELLGNWKQAADLAPGRSLASSSSQCFPF